MQRQKRKKPEIVIPKGYDLEDMLDTDDAGYGLETEAPALQEEVKLRIEREEIDKTGKRIR